MLLRIDGLGVHGNLGEKGVKQPQKAGIVGTECLLQKVVRCRPRRGDVDSQHSWRYIVGHQDLTFTYSPRLRVETGRQGRPESKSRLLLHRL